MIENTIVEEIHRIREQLVAEHNGDLRAMLATIRRGTEQAAKAGRQVASPTPRGLRSRLRLRRRWDS
jgi:hypothetical protein